MELNEIEVKQLLDAIVARTPKQQAEQSMMMLYRGYSLAIRQYVWKNWMQDSAEIEEIIQDTFMEVWKHSDRFRGESKFKTWLLGIARNKAIDKLRQNKGNVDSWDDMEDAFADNALPITEVIHQEQIRLGLKFCLESLSLKGRLSDAHREVLHLAYVEDQDIAEIAGIVGCPENTVKTRLHHARLKVKDCLSRRLRGDRPDE